MTRDRRSQASSAAAAAGRAGGGPGPAARLGPSPARRRPGATCCPTTSLSARLRLAFAISRTGTGRTARAATDSQAAAGGRRPWPLSDVRSESGRAAGSAAMIQLSDPVILSGIEVSWKYSTVHVWGKSYIDFCGCGCAASSSHGAALLLSLRLGMMPGAKSFRVLLLQSSRIPQKQDLCHYCRNEIFCPEWRCGWGCLMVQLGGGQLA